MRILLVKLQVIIPKIHQFSTKTNYEIKKNLNSIYKLSNILISKVHIIFNIYYVYKKIFLIISIINIYAYKEQIIMLLKKLNEIFKKL